MTATTPQPKSRGRLLAWMIISQLLAVASLFLWLLLAGLSVMAFDSGVTKEAWTVVIAVWAYPIFPIVMVIGSWMAYARRRNVLAAILSGLSFALPAVLYIAMWVQTTLWSLQNPV